MQEDEGRRDQEITNDQNQNQIKTFPGKNVIDLQCQRKHRNNYANRRNANKHMYQITPDWGEFFVIQYQIGYSNCQSDTVTQ